MKKLLFLIAISLLNIGGFGQTKTWSDTISINRAQSAVVYSPGVLTFDASGYKWSQTVETIGLTAKIYISLGGSNNPVGTSKTVYSFNRFGGLWADTFPFTYIPDSARTITNYYNSSGVLQSDTSYQQTFKSNNCYGYKVPEIQVTTTLDTIFTLIIHNKFTY